MAKILLYTDVHFSIYSSIIRSRGKKYSKRLENLINSLNWAEQLAEIERCDEVICLGDFFDKSILDAEEITALQEINWANLPHTFIVGNHESNIKSLIYSSVKALQNKGFNIVDKPSIKDLDNCRLYFIPYLLDEDRKTIKEYVEEFPYLGKKIFLSHNDIKGIKYGMYESKDGFDINDIDNNCDLFLNGHLHNGQPFSKKGINLGNLTGQNFGEDSFKYEHCAFILDTNNNEVKIIENPYAFNFYQISILDKNDFNKLNNLKNQAIVSIKCVKNCLEEFKSYLKTVDKIEESRVIILPETTDVLNESIDIKDLANVDYLEQFRIFVLDKLGNTEDVIDEINNIIKE